MPAFAATAGPNLHFGPQIQSGILAETMTRYAVPMVEMKVVRVATGDDMGSSLDTTFPTRVGHRILHRAR